MLRKENLLGRLQIRKTRRCSVGLSLVDHEIQRPNRLILSSHQLRDLLAADVTDTPCKLSVTNTRCPNMSAATDIRRQTTRGERTDCFIVVETVTGFANDGIVAGGRLQGRAVSMLKGNRRQLAWHTSVRLGESTVSLIVFPNTTSFNNMALYGDCPFCDT